MFLLLLSYLDFLYFLTLLCLIYCDTARRPRSRVTTPEEDRRIIQAADDEERPVTSAVKLREALQLDVSVDTIRRRLHEAHIHCRVPAKKEWLTEQHRQVRLQFALEHGEKDADFWSRVVFTDEKTFRSSDHGVLRVWRRNNTR